MYAQDVLEGSGPAHRGDGTHHGGEEIVGTKHTHVTFDFAELRRNTKISYVISWYKNHVGWRRLLKLWIFGISFFHLFSFLLFLSLSIVDQVLQLITRFA